MSSTFNCDEIAGFCESGTPIILPGEKRTVSNVDSSLFAPGRGEAAQILPFSL